MEEADIVAYNEGLYVAVSRGGSVIESTNGTNWISRTAVNERIFDAAIGNGMVAMAASEGRIYYSSNRIVWNLAETRLLSDIAQIRFRDGKFSALTAQFNSPKLLLESANGSDWKIIGETRESLPAAPPLPPYTIQIQDAFAASTSGFLRFSKDERFLYALDGNVIWKTEDVIHWEIAERLPDDFRAQVDSPAAGNFARMSNGFLVIDAKGALRRKMDGGGWDSLSLPPDLSVSTMAYGNGALVVGANKPYRPMTLYTSTNFVDWSSVEMPGNSWAPVTFNDGRFLVGAVLNTDTEDRILLETWSSSNGVDWQTTVSNRRRLGRPLLHLNDKALLGPIFGFIQFRTLQSFSLSGESFEERPTAVDFLALISWKGTLVGYAGGHSILQSELFGELKIEAGPTIRLGFRDVPAETPLRIETAIDLNAGWTLLTNTTAGALPLLELPHGEERRFFREAPKP